MTTKQIEEIVRQVTAEEIDVYVKCAIDRYRELFSDWEIFYMAIPKGDPKERAQTIQYIIEMLQKMQADQV